MAVEREIIEAQIQALGKIDSFGTKKEIKYLPEVIMPGETILGLCSGLMDGTTWLCVVTERRMLMLDKGFITGLKHLEIPVSKILSVSFKTGFVFGELLIDSGGQIKIMKQVVKEDAAKMSGILSELLYKKDSQPAPPASAPPVSATPAASAAPAATVDVITQLERLAALKEKGILTDEEFAAEKARLLSPTGQSEPQAVGDPPSPPPPATAAPTPAPPPPPAAPTGNVRQQPAPPGSKFAEEFLTVSLEQSIAKVRERAETNQMNEGEIKSAVKSVMVPLSRIIAVRGILSAEEEEKIMGFLSAFGVNFSEISPYAQKDFMTARKNREKAGKGL